MKKILDLARLMRNEHLSPSQINSLQLTKLKRVVSHAYHHVPMYRQLFETSSITPENIQTLGDLRHLPIISKNTFREYGKRKCIDESIKNPENLIHISTSGSSGNPFSFFIDQRHDQFRKAQFLRPYLSNKQKLLDKTALFRISSRIQSKKWFEHIGLLPTISIPSGASAAEQIEILLKSKPAVVRGYPSVLNLIAHQMIKDRVRLPSIKQVFTDSETLTIGARQVIEEAFAVKVIDVFGSMETENIAYQCIHQKGYHLCTDTVIVEFIKNGEIARPGEVGEMVCTVLDNFTTPFIRYNLGDFGRYLTEPCSCGISFPLFEITGARNTDYITLSNGSQISAAGLLGDLHVLASDFYEFQVIQNTPDTFKILINPTPSFNDSSRKVIADIFARNLPGSKLKVDLVERVPRTAAGKMRPFIPHKDARHMP